MRFAPIVAAIAVLAAGCGGCHTLAAAKSTGQTGPNLDALKPSEDEMVAIRRDIYKKHPFVAANLYRALVAAKQHAMHKMRIQVSLRYMLPWLADHIDEIDSVFGGDAFP